MQKSGLPVEKAVAEAGKAQEVREFVLLADNGVRVEGGGLVYTGDVKRVTKREKRKIKKRMRGRKAEEDGSPRESGKAQVVRESVPLADKEVAEVGRRR